ncbi:ParB/RepB/Spo0J family partition protein [Streptomyces sp. NRRL S-350]|uniref:ParB/RepB/Spo0J family partition protein n=1 Tax=Streptomyces sp. NRRL S-350 TaxID=1463902 RepID=UPI0004C2AFE8|nr:ParB/RepB/Spo0J family partition protein [Streptomyces sp. NRRL S-350]
MTRTKVAAKPAEPTQTSGIEYFEFLSSQLIVDPFNHRQGKVAPPSPRLKASVAEVGVKEAVGVRRQADGTWGVFKGRRRLLAAQEAAEKAKAKGIDPKTLPPVPALVHHDLTDADDETLLLSLLENQFRENATKADELQVAEQLALMDVPEARRRRHAKVLGVSAAQLKAAKGAAQLSESDRVNALHADFDWVEMDQWQQVGGGWADFQKLKDAKKRDLASGKAGNGEWRQTLQAIKDRQAEEAKRQAVTDELSAAGVRVIDFPWRWLGHTAQPLAHLLTALGKPLTTEVHSQVCPSHGATVDPDTLEVIYVCTNWHAEGHLPTEEYAKELEEAGKTPVDPEAEKAKAKAKREGTAAWRSARTVRQEVLRAAIAGKNLPEAADALTERTVMGHAKWWFKSVASGRTEVAAFLLGVPDPNEGRSQWERAEDPFAELIATGPKTRRRHRMFARVVAAIEYYVMGDKEWLEPTEDMVTYLRFLEETFDYPLAECERDAIAAYEAKTKQDDKADGGESADTDDQGDGDGGSAGESSPAPEAQPEAAPEPQAQPAQEGAAGEETGAPDGPETEQQPTGGVQAQG